ncbi:MAG: bifunctional YncE family protein/alkaline phosphatase family protein [Bacteroidota bacterium]|nr:bifunctional YncE family protein/alkaline phosphatase family protein [Bacteroidota bacterium]MDP4211399.1 bifunctional YncE family protein/alkaline phosphatase family protein [Bacteroidota bacterium]MDP4248626.1 bifunctional YncE family protein/alkaline phosphatase family protein [Bacteroidota bacterium]
MICRKYLLIVLSLFVFSGISRAQQDPIAPRIQLPNGWSLTPVGASLSLGDLPLNIAVSPSKKLIAVTNNGQSTQTIQLFDAVHPALLSEVIIPKSWLGLVFSGDEKWLYASGGNDNRILKYGIVNRKLILTDSIILGKPWPEKISPAGMDLDDASQILYVVTKENNHLYIVNLKTKRSDSVALGAEAYTCLLSPNKRELYISLWGGDRILIYDTRLKRITNRIAVGDNPNDICLTKNGKYLFVANANDNSVSVMDIQKRKLLETLNAALYPASPAGSTSNALALSADEKTLYIANADNNCLAIFDVSHPGYSKSKGFIPVGWYPTAVKVIGKRVFVANGKGFTSLPNPGYRAFDTSATLSYQKGAAKSQYIGGLFTGSLSIFKEPGPATLSHYSRLVYENCRYNKKNELTAPGEEGNPVPRRIGDSSPIKYVFYIIKENRTYDQVLGDMPEGNGDTSLCIFGEKITPNLHALAREFVLMDNFYVDAEVSEDGHNWSMGGYATDYLEKTWPTGYGDRGGDYSGEGNRAIANNKGGFIWDHCARAGVSYRTYGEFADDYKPNIPVLKGHYCHYYTSWDQTVRDTTRVGQWKRDFDSLVAIHALPQLNTLRIINDHTEGLRKGRPTPFAHCADNDLAVGMFVDYLSKSPVWKESVVFILEDDAQDGPDHVDAHRSPVYVAGGFVRRHMVDHTMYSTTSVLHTIELILGVPPMSQYDAAATPMWRCFSKTADLTPFDAKPLQTDINKRNFVENAWQRKSETFDFSKEDRVPDRIFTEVIWKAVKGADAVVPAPKRAAFVNINEAKGDD